MWSRIRNRLRFPFRRARFERELMEEMEFHRRMLERDQARVGLDGERAIRAARQQFGNAVAAQEYAGEVWTFRWFDALRADLRYGLRGMRRSPAFTLVAILSLALGIGANTAIFTLINAVMLTALPVSHPHELVLLAQRGGPQKSSVTFGPALWRRIHDEQDVFSSVAAYGATSGGDLGTGEGRQATIGLVSGGFFPTLGVRAAIGRTLAEGDDRPGCPAVAVITHGYWRSVLGAREDVLAQSIPLNNRPFQIVGVADAEFFGIEYGAYVPVWVPQCAAPLFLGAGANPGGGWVIGRLRPDVSLAQSRVRMAALAPHIFEAAATASSSGRTIEVVPLETGLPFLRDRYGEALFILMATVGIVLLIACTNVASLMLARTSARWRDITVRLAIGASRGRIVRQLLTESLLLAFTGAAAGVAIAHWGSRGLLRMFSDSIMLDLAPDLRVLTFTIALATVTGVLFGLAPAYRAARLDPQRVLGDRGVVEGQSRFWPGQALTAAQIALSLAMVAIALLLVGSWSRLLAIDTGFRPRGVLIAAVGTGSARIPADRQADTFAQVLERLRAVSGARAVAAAWITPLGQNARVILNAEGFSTLRAADVESRLNHVSDGYFRTIGTPLLAGREFGPADAIDAPPVVIVNQELARRLYGRTDVVGQRFRVQRNDGLSDPIEIVGVAGDTTWGSLREARQPIMYDALSQIAEPGRAMGFLMRTDGRLSALGPGVKAAVLDIDPRLTVTLTSLEQRISDSVRLPRTLAALSGFFGGLALLLTMIGLYGIASYSVQRRRGEIGVRVALGATRSRIVGMVLGGTGRVVVAGIAAGVALSLAASRLVSSFLYGTTGNNPATLALSAGIMLCVSIGAALMPAHRAARMSPVDALRED
jgi:predicted permease